jgi:hypothetical protein
MRWAWGDSSVHTGRIASACSLFIPKRSFLFVLLAPHLVTKIGLDFCPASVSRPVGRGSLPQDILQIESRTAFDEKSDELTMAGPSGLMQGCRMGMGPDRVVSIGIFTRVKQQSNDLDMTKLRGQRERQVAIPTVGTRKQPAGLLDNSQSRRHRQINPSAAPDQSVQRFQLAVQGRSVHSAVGIRSVIAKQID